MNAITHLQNLIRIDTSNPPGNEVLAAVYLAEHLRKAGYDPEIIESAPGRGNVIARFHGDGQQRPLLLYNHLDVVPVEREHWERDPFGGELLDDVIWGRGALDMKNVVTQQLMVMLKLAEERPSLRRDVIFAGCADEETDGTLGLGYLVSHHRSKVEAEIGLSEAGASPLYAGNHTYYPIQCGEKGNCRLLLRAMSAPGHGATPDYNNYAIRNLALALDRLTRQHLPVHLTRIAQTLLQQLAKSTAIEDVINEADLEQILSQITSQTLRAEIFYMTRNSAAPTLLQAGTSINVIPSSAEAQLDGRILPGQTCDDLIAEVRDAIGSDLAVEIVHLAEHDIIALEADAHGPVWETLVRNLERHDPNAQVIPIILAGGTDATHLAPVGTQTYGFSPMLLPRNFKWQGLVHGHNERIPASALQWGIDVLYDTVIDLCR